MRLSLRDKMVLLAAQEMHNEVIAQQLELGVYGFFGEGARTPQLKHGPPEASWICATHHQLIVMGKSICTVPHACW